MQNIRESIEEKEMAYLSPYATKAVNSKGNIKEIEKCPYRTVFQRDRDRIIYSKSFRRLMNKTQMFINPIGDHYTTRLTHTLEVSQIGRAIARALKLNEDLVESMALGHDLGHTPFGHSGEDVLNKIAPFHFIHAEQSIRVINILEKNGNGLSLTYETIDGIANHSKNTSKLLEGRVVYFADKIAYLNHDTNDCIRAGVLKYSDIPKLIRKYIGNNNNNNNIVSFFIEGIIKNSMDRAVVDFDNSSKEIFDEYRNFMFKNMYLNPEIKKGEYKAKNVVEKLYEYYLEKIDEIPHDYKLVINNEETFSKERAVCDYISGMSDRYAILDFERLFLPRP